MEVKVTGDKDLFELLYRVETAHYTREATAMYIANVGCVVCTKTHWVNGPMSESTCFVPNVVVVPYGSGNRLEEI